LDIDQVTQRLGEHTAQLNVHQAKFQFDSQQADSARAAEIATLARIDAERATLAAIEDRERAKGCMVSSPSGTASSGSGNTASTASVKSNASEPLFLASAATSSTTKSSSTTTTTAKSSNSNKNNNNNSAECQNLAAQHAQVNLDLAHDSDVLSTVRSARTRYEGYVRDDNETLISDHQTVDQDQRDLDDAKNALKAGTISDQKTILDTQRTGDLTDQQTVASARNDVDTAQSQVGQQVAAKAANEERPQNQAEVAAAQQDATSKLQAVNDAQKALDDTTLLSPADGTVAVIGGRLGEDVPGGGSN